MKKIFLLIMLSYSVFCEAQNIKGSVTDATTNKALQGATIVLKNTEKNTSSDEQGVFHFDEMPSGNYTAEVSSVGYAKAIIKDVVVKKGADTELNIALQVSDNELNTILVNGERNDPFAALQTKYVLGVEQTLRTPAAFNDPARLAMQAPGVVNDNDQANGLSIRGYSPDAMQWRLEGVEIINPNHLSNAGSFFDQATANSGGTNALSTQMLGTSSLITGGFTGEYNNVISGAMDMRLRNGNAEKHRFTTQVSLVGLDVAAEGPFSKKSAASYLVNYRYSTVGLLQKMGVPLSDEVIGFQDLAWNVHLPLGKKSNLKVFGMLGNSSNTFETKKDTVASDRDLSDVYFKDKLQVYGASFKHNNGFEMVFVRSSTAPNNLNKYYSEKFDSSIILTNAQNNTKNSFKISYTEHFWENTTIKIGANMVHRNFKAIFFPSTGINSYLPSLFFDVNHKYRKFNFLFSLAVEKYKLENAFTLDSMFDLQILPKFSVQYNINASKKLILNIAKQHKILESDRLFFENEQWASYQSNLTYLYKKEKKQLMLNIYFNVNQQNRSSSSTITNPFGFSQLLNPKLVFNYGLEASYHQELENNFYYAANINLFKVDVGAVNNYWKSFYNNRFAFKINLGKEWKKSTSKLGVATYLVSNGNHYIAGFADNINSAGTDLSKVYIGRSKYYYDFGSLTSAKYYNTAFQNYFRTDLRLYRQRDRKNWSSTLSLDIQNVTNRKNINFQYNDVIAKKVLTKYQNGLIPILGWRANF